MIKVLLENRQIFSVLVGGMLTDELPQLRLVSRLFNRKIKEFLEVVEELVRGGFSKCYGRVLVATAIKCRFIRGCQPPQQAKLMPPRETRIAIRLSARLSEQATVNRSYVLAYSYQCWDRKKSKPVKLFWELQFDVGKGTRTVWLYREETRNHFVKEKTSLIQDILPVRIGDTVHLDLPVLTSFGLSNIASLEFYPMVEEAVGERVCSIENQFEWTLHKYFERPVQFEVEDIIRCYPQHLELKEIRCAGVGYYNYKIQLKCIKQGVLAGLMGHDIRIVGQNDPVTIQLKKRGSYDQQRSTLELRLGDILIIYFTPNE